MRVVPALTGALLAIATSVGAIPARAGDDYRKWSCDELWETRNAIYKAAGYCFTTPKAIKRFGNAGCQFDDVRDVPLSQSQRDQISEMHAAERAKGCRR
ncbi:MAG: YARHG domain-containing protein [Hyphomicrobium sp.]